MLISVTAPTRTLQSNRLMLKNEDLMVRDGVWISNSQRVENKCSAWNVGQSKHEDTRNTLFVE